MIRPEVMLHVVTREPEIYQRFCNWINEHNRIYPSSPFTAQAKEICEDMEASYGQRLSRILAQAQIEAGENDDDLPEDE